MEEKKMFRVIIAGSRNFSDYRLLKDKCLKILSKKIMTDNVVVISGGARGTDVLGERFAKELGLQLLVFPADWVKYGKSAGYKRNLIMSENADALIAFWNGESLGTQHMIDIMIKSNKPYRVIQFKKGNI